MRGRKKERSGQKRKRWKKEKKLRRKRIKKWKKKRWIEEEKESKEEIELRIGEKQRRREAGREEK